jgi:hypothetical protein
MGRGPTLCEIIINMLLIKQFRGKCTLVRDRICLLPVLKLHSAPPQTVGNCTHKVFCSLFLLYTVVGNANINKYRSCI